MTAPGTAPADGQLPKVHAHPQDLAEEYLAETFEEDESGSTGYDRGHMIDAYHAGFLRARELTAAAMERERSAPADGQARTPGQAAYETVYADFAVDEDWSPGMWAELAPWQRERWEAAAKAAIDASGLRKTPEQVGTIAGTVAGQIARERDQARAELAGLRAQEFRIITGSDGKRHMVDAGGVRQLTETGPDSWELALSAGNWAAITAFARGVLATGSPPAAEDAQGLERVTCDLCGERHVAALVRRKRIGGEEASVCLDCDAAPATASPDGGSGGGADRG